MFFLFFCAVILLYSEPSVCDCESQQADDCTSGFMSVDRIEAAVQGSSRNEDHVLGELSYFPDADEQDIAPNLNFTCNGSILSWTFAAQRAGNSSTYTELQIWRSSGDGFYIKVGSTTIMLEEENPTQLYQYTLTSPLPFQAGDIFGFFQHSMSVHLLYEHIGSGHPLYYALQDNPSNIFLIDNSFLFESVHMLINVETDPAGCGCGFMSVERMRIVMGLDTVGDRAFLDPRQQITPNITFTCDGLVTKWIIGAAWLDNGNLYPELQVWRNVGNDLYHKINSTVLKITTLKPSNIYEYDMFSPIPVLVGDVLGVFQPQLNGSKLALWTEVASNNTTTNDSIDLQSIPSLSSQGHHPLVTVEMIVDRPTSLALLPSTANSEKSTVLVTQFITTVAISTTSLPQTKGRNGASAKNTSLFISVGVAGILIILLTAAVVIITVLVCLRRKKDKPNVTDNVMLVKLQ